MLNRKSAKTNEIPDAKIVRSELETAIFLHSVSADEFVINSTPRALDFIDGMSALNFRRGLGLAPAPYFDNSSGIFYADIDGDAFTLVFSAEVVSQETKEAKSISVLDDALDSALAVSGLTVKPAVLNLNNSNATDYTDVILLFDNSPNHDRSVNTFMRGVAKNVSVLKDSYFEIISVFNTYSNFVANNGKIWVYTDGQELRIKNPQILVRAG